MSLASFCYRKPCPAYLCLVTWFQASMLRKSFRGPDTVRTSTLPSGSHRPLVFRPFVRNLSARPSSPPRSVALLFVSFVSPALPLASRAFVVGGPLLVGPSSRPFACFFLVFGSPTLVRTRKTRWTVRVLPSSVKRKRAGSRSHSVSILLMLILCKDVSLSRLFEVYDQVITRDLHSSFEGHAYD